jgi:hypothetical protein
MTTIVCHDKVLYADSKKVLKVGAYITITYGDKIFLEPGFAIGVAGLLPHPKGRKSLAENILGNIVKIFQIGDITDTKEIDGIAESKYLPPELVLVAMFSIDLNGTYIAGQYIMSDGKDCVTTFDTPLCIGSGDESFSFALHAGLSTRRAVETAISHDALSGGDIKTIHFNEIKCIKWPAKVPTKSVRKRK